MPKNESTSDAEIESAAVSLGRLWHHLPGLASHQRSDGAMPISHRGSDLAMLDTARGNISAFVILQARMRQDRLGFGWRPSACAPSDYCGLVKEFGDCEMNGLPLRVSNRHTDRTIYDSPATNLQLRYIHDTGHVIHQLSFELDDELKLASHHLEALRAEGYGPDTMEHQLLHADTFGQAYFQLITGHFVGNQVRFDTNCVRVGVEEAVAQELSALAAGQ